MKPWQPRAHSKARSQPCLLVGDIGGTNARFALASPDRPGFTMERLFECRQFESADVAITTYLKKIKAPPPSVICIAAAGPVIDGNVHVTNNSWSLHTADLEKAFEGSSVRLLNDFEAVAYSIPHLGEQDCLPVGMPAPIDLNKPDFTVGIAGPGTGLGVAGLCQRNGLSFPVFGEGGHVGFAPETQVQMEVFEQLRNRFDRVCDERFVSGPGVVNLFQALSILHGENIMEFDAAEIFSHAANETNGTAAEAVAIFFEILGQAAGNLALTLGAFDGIYIGGGIVSRKPELIVNSRFRTGFERKGRHRSLMEKIPTMVIMHQQPGLLGASYCALQLINEPASASRPSSDLGGSSKTGKRDPQD